MQVVQHPSKTIEIQMQMKGFHAEAGQVKSRTVMENLGVPRVFSRQPA